MNTAVTCSATTYVWVEDTLSPIVVEAARRLRDEGLRARVLAAEGRRVTAEAHRRSLSALLMRPWRDLWGSLHCARCGGLLPGEPGIDSACSCPRVVAA